MGNQYLQELLGYARQGVGKTLAEPSEYGYVSDYLKNLMGYQPSQFQFPMEDIQKALSAQQGLQMQDYLQQIRPSLASQGQLDSTYYTNLLGKYLQGQQAQTYGTTADLLTQQALNNMQIQQWLPSFQSGVAGQLAGLGGQRAGINQYNLEYPYQTYIPALSGIFGQGMGLAGQQYQANLVPYQYEIQRYEADRQAKKQQQQQLMQLLGGAAMGAVTGGIGGFAGMYPSIAGGTMGSFGQGALQGLGGYSPSLANLGRSSYLPMDLNNLSLQRSRQATQNQFGGYSF